MGQLIGIAMKRRPHGDIETLSKAFITSSVGIKGDYRGGHAHPDRRITVLSSEQWQEACDELGTCLPWTVRRANLFVTGIRFGPADIGRKLYVCPFYKNLELEITGETKPCNRMDKAHPGLRKVLETDWRGGVTCRVVSDAVIIEVQDDVWVG